MSTPVETTPDVLEEFKEWLHHERASAKQWTWLESNPPVFNNYIKQLGVLDHELVDIYGSISVNFILSFSALCLSVLLPYTCTYTTYATPND